MRGTVDMTSGCIEQWFAPLFAKIEADFRLIVASRDPVRYTSDHLDLATVASDNKASFRVDRVHTFKATDCIGYAWSADTKH